MSWTGDGDRLQLPCCDEKIGMNSSMNSSTTITDTENDNLRKVDYKKKFMEKCDFLFSNASSHDSNVAAANHFSSPRSANDGIRSVRCIKDHVKKIKKFNSQNATHVLILGFDDIRFNMGVKPSEIATRMVPAYKDAAEEVKIQGINLWCTTIPEIGDLDAEFREFNNCLRRAAVDGRLGAAKLFDLAAATLSRPNSTFKERHYMLYSFFEHQLSMKLMKDKYRSKFPLLQDPDKYIVQKGTSEFIQEHVTPIVTTENAVFADAAAVNDQQQNPPVQINTGNPLADMLASLYLRDNTNA